jgi:hypothetical protein
LNALKFFTVIVQPCGSGGEILKLSGIEQEEKE